VERCPEKLDIAHPSVRRANFKVAVELELERRALGPNLPTTVSEPPIAAAWPAKVKGVREHQRASSHSERPGLVEGQGGAGAAGGAPVAAVALLDGVAAAGRVAVPLAAVALAAECGYIYYLRSEGTIDAVQAKNAYVVAGAGSAGGAVGGMLAGAVAGSFVPGIGTVVGAAVDSVLPLTEAVHSRDSL